MTLHPLRTCRKTKEEKKIWFYRWDSLQIFTKRQQWDCHITHIFFLVLWWKKKWKFASTIRVVNKFISLIFFPQFYFLSSLPKKSLRKFPLVLQKNYDNRNYNFAITRIKYLFWRSLVVSSSLFHLCRRLTDLFLTSIWISAFFNFNKILKSRMNNKSVITTFHIFHVHPSQ